MNNDKLENMRKEIDKIDNKLANLLSQRFHIVEEICKYKKENGIEIEDINREKKVINNILSGKNSKDFHTLKEIFFKIFELSKKFQNIKKK